MIILLTGLPGTGKSHLARALAETLGADVIDRDQVRDAIFPRHDLDYSEEQNELASQVVYSVAAYILKRKTQRILILDGRPFSRRVQVDEVVRLAGAVQHELRVIHCTAPESVVRQRLEEDMRMGGNVAANRTVEKYLRIKQSFEPLIVPHLTIDTSEPLGAVVQEVGEYVRKAV